MTPPTGLIQDPAQKRRALDTLTRVNRHYEDAKRERDLVISLASICGASTKDISRRTGLSRRKIERAIERCRREPVQGPTRRVADDKGVGRGSS